MSVKCWVDRIRQGGGTQYSSGRSGQRKSVEEASLKAASNPNPLCIDRLAYVKLAKERVPQASQGADSAHGAQQHCHSAQCALEEA